MNRSVKVCAMLLCSTVVLSVALLTPVHGLLSRSPIVYANPAFRGDDRFGLVWINPPGSIANSQRTKQAVESGARWDRFPFYWYEMQPSPSSAIDFNKMDAVVDHDLANGIQVQGILLGAPQWAISSGKISLESWQQFVYQTVLHFRDKVSFWEIWNEPDLLDGNGRGLFWWGSIEDYAELLKVGYTAVKTANPNAKVLLGALAFPYNNQDFFPKLLDVLAKDVAAPANDFYFDILPLHLYGRASTFFDLPIGYVGKPDFPGFRNLMRSKGFEKPIWVNEAGVGVWDTGSGKNAPGRATMDEQAAYIMQAFAYGIVSGIDKIFVFQLYDDGAGAHDPQTGLPAEYYGLVSNSGVPRPAYTAYQVAARYLSGAKLATRVNLWRNGNPDVKGVDIITLYGTPHGRVTLAWNYDGGSTKQVRISASRPKAILMDKLGRQQEISAVNGIYLLDVRPATNANNFGCFTPSGCNPNDFIIGGDPVILIEDDHSLPPSAVRPLPSGVNAPFTITWGLTKPVQGVVRYDIQYMDPEEGVWRDWLLGTTATSATFGTSSTPVQLNHTYIFRSRVTDSNGNLIDGFDYPNDGMASTVVLGGSTVAGPLPPAQVDKVDARIQIVWPHDNKPVSQATRVNIGAYIFQSDTLTVVSPAWSKEVKLWRSLNNGIEELVSTGKKRVVTHNGLSYPIWDFNDIDVSQARDPLNKYYFRLSVDDLPSSSNIWSHGADARTYFPKMDTPSGVANSTPSAIDAKIQIVWPHGNLPVEQALKANVGVYLFEKGTSRSVPLSFDQPVRLWQALNNEPARQVAIGKKEYKTENGITFPIWTFNNIDVGAAREGLNKYYFRVTVDGVPSFSNVWSHGKDARTYLPQPEIPRGVIPN